MANDSRKRSTSSALKKLLTRASADQTKVELPRAVHEIRVSADPEDIIPAGTVITEEIAVAAGFEDGTIAELEAKGAIDFVEVFAQAPAGDEPPAADA